MHPFVIGFIALFLTSSLCVDSVFAESVSQSGSQGAAGTDGSDGDPGQSGGPGQTGEALSATLTSPDRDNSLTLIGGVGGDGGAGGDALSLGFDGGNGGRGGDGGNASGAATTNGTGNVEAEVEIRGGDGGVGGLGGRGLGVGSDGPAGRGGDGGIASILPAGVSATSSDRDAEAIASVYGGDGGVSAAPNGGAGHGGSATISGGIIRASGPRRARMTASLTGGDGGSATGSGDSGNGGNVTADNPFDPNALVGDFVGLGVFQSGGSGGVGRDGVSVAGLSGNGGNTLLNLSYDADANELGSLIMSQGGRPSRRFSATGQSGAGGDVDENLNLENRGEIAIQSVSGGGDGGSAQDGATGGDGGHAQSSTRLMSDEDKADGDFSLSGGRGGFVSSGNGAGGNGGDAVGQWDVSAAQRATARGSATAGSGGTTFSGVPGSGGSAQANTTTYSNAEHSRATSSAAAGDIGRRTSPMGNGEISRLSTTEPTGGNATSHATATTDGDGKIAQAQATSFGGRHPVGSFGNQYANGAGTAEATAVSTAISGTAHSIARSSGRIARSRSAATGLDGTVVASSFTAAEIEPDSMRPGSIRVTNQVTASVSDQMQVSTYVAADGTLWNPDDSTESNVYSLLAINPSTENAPKNQRQESISTLDFDPPELVIEGEFAGGYPANGVGTVVFSIEQDFLFDDDLFINGDAGIAFDDFASTGDGFETFSLLIETNSFSQTWSFTDLEDAQTFFTGNEIALGKLAGAAERISVTLDWQSSQGIDSIAARYILTARAVPEPESAIFLAIFCTASLRRRRRFPVKINSQYSSNIV